MMFEFKTLIPSTSDKSYTNGNDTIKSMISQIPGIEIITPEEDESNMFIFGYDGYNNGYVGINCKYVSPANTSYPYQICFWLYKDRELTTYFNFKTSTSNLSNYYAVSDSNVACYNSMLSNSFYCKFGDNNLYIHLHYFRILFWTEPNGKKYMTVFLPLSYTNCSDFISEDQIISGSMNLENTWRMGCDATNPNRGLLLPVFFDSHDREAPLYSKELFFTNSNIVGNISAGTTVFINKKEYIKLFGSSGRYNVIVPK